MSKIIIDCIMPDEHKIKRNNELKPPRKHVLNQPEIQLEILPLGKRKTMKNPSWKHFSGTGVILT